jgi:prophage regulatory protein
MVITVMENTAMTSVKGGQGRRGRGPGSQPVPARPPSPPSAGAAQGQRAPGPGLTPAPARHPSPGRAQAAESTPQAGGLVQLHPSAQGVPWAPPDVLLRIPDVKQMTGMSRTEIYRRLEAGRFPRPVQLGPQSIAWRQSEVQQWIASLPMREAKPPPSQTARVALAKHKRRGAPS